MTQAIRITQRGSMVRNLLVCGVVGPLLFIVVFLIEGATRPGYSAWHNFVSSLSLGDLGWIQVLNFIVSGTLILCFAIGLRQALHSGRGAMLAPVLLAIFAIGLIVAGVFVTDPSLGYPPGAALSKTMHGTIHGLAGLIVFNVLALACLVMGWRFVRERGMKGWAIYSFASGILVWIFFYASTAMSAMDELGTMPDAPVGLLQRIAIVVGWVWIALLAYRYLGELPA